MSKRYQDAVKQIEEGKQYTLAEAVRMVKQIPAAKFDESVEFSASLSVDPSKSDQLVRGTVQLPHGTGKTLRVLVFCQGEAEREATEAGADYVGLADLVKKIQEGWLEFDVAMTTPDLMKDVARLGRILGPRGLMPSAKAGTVTPDVGKAVKDVKRGKVEFKMDKLGNLHVVIGRRSFEVEQLVENAKALVKAVQQGKPSAVKGRVFRRMSLCSTMGPGIPLDVQAFLEPENGEDV